CFKSEGTGRFSTSGSHSVSVQRGCCFIGCSPTTSLAPHPDSTSRLPPLSMPPVRQEGSMRFSFFLPRSPVPVLLSDLRHSAFASAPVNSQELPPSARVVHAKARVHSSIEG